MIARFTMRQALSGPDLLGNALVTPPLPACCRLLGQQPRDSAYVPALGLIIIARSRSPRRRITSHLQQEASVAVLGNRSQRWTTFLPFTRRRGGSLGRSVL